MRAMALRVLVVEDDQSMSLLLRRVLERHGFDVAVVHCGEDAERHAQSRHIDMMIVDLHLNREMRGDVMFHHVSAIQPHLATSTLFLTADITERAEDYINACECPMVRKPFDLAELMRAVNALVPRSNSASA
jgi:DNA-binding response OmpR family regulator